MNPETGLFFFEYDTSKKTTFKSQSYFMRNEKVYLNL